MWSVGTRGIDHGDYCAGLSLDYRIFLHSVLNPKPLNPKPLNRVESGVEPQIHLWSPGLFKDHVFDRGYGDFPKLGVPFWGSQR